MFVLCAGSFAVAAPPVWSAPPPNDDPANAAAIGSLPFTAAVDTREATVGPSEPTATCQYPDEHTVWYRYTPSANVRVYATSTWSNEEGWIKAFRQVSGSLVEINCDEARFLDLTGGTTYYFVLGGLHSGTPGGDMSLTLAPVAAAANDDFASAQPITGLPFLHAVNKATATSAPSDPSCGSGPSVWYTYATAKRRRVAVWTDFTSPRIGVYTGTQGTLTEVGCSGGSNLLDFVAMPGTTYRIAAQDSYPFSDTDWSVWVFTQKLPASLSIQPNSNRINYGNSVRLKVHLTPPTDPDNKEVRILATPKGGTTVVVGTGNVDENGDFFVFDKPTRDTVYTADWAGDERYEAASARPLTVHVRTRVVANLAGFYGRRGADKLYREGRPVRVNVAVAPNHAGSRVFLTLYAKVGNRWQKLRLRPDAFRLGPGSKVSVGSAAYRTATATSSGHIPSLTTIIGRAPRSIGTSA